MTTLDYPQLYVGRDWRAPATGNRIAVPSASTEELIGTVPEAVEEDVDTAVGAARAAFDDPQGWSRWPATGLQEVLGRFAVALEARGEETARRVSMQNGMPITLAQSFESGFPALLLRYYVTLVQGGAEERRPGMLGSDSLVLREPIGVVAVLVWWNVPRAITLLKLASALAAGCTVVLKPAPEAVLDAFLMAEAAAEAGLPAASSTSCPAGGRSGLPGRPPAGGQGVLHRLDRRRPQHRRDLRAAPPPGPLELGGKSAAVVLDDADMAATIESFFASTLLNNGQICWLGTRVLAPPLALRRGRRHGHGPGTFPRRRRPAGRRPSWAHCCRLGSATGSRRTSRRVPARVPG